MWASDLLYKCACSVLWVCTVHMVNLWLQLSEKKQQNKQTKTQIKPRKMQKKYHLNSHNFFSLTLCLWVTIPYYKSSVYVCVCLVLFACTYLFNCICSCIFIGENMKKGNSKHTEDEKKHRLQMMKWKRIEKNAYQKYFFDLIYAKKHKYGSIAQRKTNVCMHDFEQSQLTN